MNTRREFLVGSFSILAAAVALPLLPSARVFAQSAIPRMPGLNPFLAKSAFPISHSNPGATEAVPHAGPTKGRQLTAADVKTIPNVFTSHPTVKNVGGERIIIASGVDGIRKILATGDAFELIDFIAYPGHGDYVAKATPAAIEAALEKADAAYREKDDTAIMALSGPMSDSGFNRRQIAGGAYNMIDKDGFHYAPSGGLTIVKSTDDNQPRGKLRIVKSKDLAADVPAELKASVTYIVGITMSYAGDVIVAAHGALFLLDRELEFKGVLPIPGEAIENSICADEKGIYVVTSRRMLKVVWTGTKLSFDETDGGWQSPYNTMSPERAKAAGALTVSGGSGTTPSLMGFGDDPDKLVVISDADPQGAQVVAFWRDEIPADFKQQPGTQSRRIAGQIRTDISTVTIEPSFSVLGYGVVVQNGAYPQPVPDIWSNAFSAGVTRPAPFGIQKFTWNTQTRSFEKNWINQEVDNTDVMVPVVAAANRMIYLASKKDGIYEYLGVDWDTGETKARWPFPDDSRKWNAWGGITALLEDGDLLIGGVFAIKRVNIGGNGQSIA
ncbi:hypothetical protein Q8X48_23565 [Pseudomonas sp. QLc11A]|jgi:hypothetical protein|uniref:Uncharacterized protein n=1 Tax=Pseudomonas azerbaijanorientalis TaxID=2842350 RepID=A0ABW8W1A5_9PSED